MRTTNPNRNPRFPHHDLLHLEGDLDGPSWRLLHVNARHEIPLDRSQFLVLAVLFSHARRSIGKPALMRTPNTSLLAASTVLRVIREFHSQFGLKLEVMVEAQPSRIIRVVSQIRKKLEKEGLKRTLIENGPTRRGYRLGVPPENVSLSLRLPDRTGPSPEP